MKIRYFLFAIVFLLIFWELCLAQWSTDPTENTPICTASNNQFAPQIVVDDKGNSMIVWEDETDPTGYRHIYAQRLNRYGYKMWDERGVPVCTAREYKKIADVVSDGQSGAIIVWLDYKNWFHPDPIEETDIYAQRIDSSGVLLWDNDGVAVCTEKGNQYFWKVLKDNSGGVFIIWDDWRLSRSNVYMQKLNRDGAPLLPENGIKFLPEYSLYCDAVTDGLNGFFICFAEYYDASFHFYAQRINSSGEKLWPNAVILDHGGWTITDDVNGFIITNGKWAQRINKSGELFWGENGVIFNEDFDEMNYIDIIPDEKSGIIITWRTSTDSADIFISRIDSIGNFLWANSIIDQAFHWTYPGKTIINDGFGNVIINFLRDINDSLKYYYVQKADSSGNVNWGGEGKVYNSKKNYWVFGSMAGDGFGGVIVVWSEFPHDIYAQQISANGNLGEIVNSIKIEQAKDIIKSYLLLQNYPNPFNLLTKISCKIPEGGDVSLKIYNLNGQLVKTLVNQKRKEGHYEVIWNGTDDNNNPITSGVYLIKLTLNQSSTIKKITLLR